MVGIRIFGAIESNDAFEDALSDLLCVYAETTSDHQRLRDCHNTFNSTLTSWIEELIRRRVNKYYVSIPTQE